MERRRSGRFRHEVRVSWINGGTHAGGATCDICCSGAFIRSKEVVPLNSIVDLEIDPGDGQDKIITRAQVVWINAGQLEDYPPGFGIEFVDGEENLEQMIIGLTISDLEKH